MSCENEVSSPEDADTVIQKLCCDMGIHRNARKGTLNAPKKILEGFKFEKKVLVDEVFPDEFDLDKTQRRIEENVRDLAKYEKPLISLGGDHSVSYPVIKALKRKYPELQLVWLDAHPDLKERVEDHVSHDVVVRKLLEEDFEEDDIWIVGYTRIDEDEKEYLEDSGLHVYGHDELEKFKREFNSCEQPVYLSTDIDVLAEELAPGTGYPDGELDMEEIEEIIRCVNPDFADLVEMAPPLDKGEKTVACSKEILSSLIKQF